MVEVRAAGLDEFANAAEMRRQMALEHEHDFDELFPGWRERYCGFFGEKQRRGEGQLFLALDGRRHAGMAIVSLIENYRTTVFGRRIAYVNGVFVYPDYRRRGIARTLMERCVTWAREQQCSQVRLRASDQGRPLYASLGFAPSNEMQLDL